MLELIAQGLAPAALLLGRPDAILTLGVVGPSDLEPHDVKALGIAALFELRFASDDRTAAVGAYDEVAAHFFHHPSA